jgi:hypothetical protein
VGGNFDALMRQTSRAARAGPARLLSAGGNGNGGGAGGRQPQQQPQQHRAGSGVRSNPLFRQPGGSQQQRQSGNNAGGHSRRAFEDTGGDVLSDGFIIDDDEDDGVNDADEVEKLPRVIRTPPGAKKPLFEGRAGFTSADFATNNFAANNAAGAWAAGAGAGTDEVHEAFEKLHEVGLYTLNAIDPELESAWFQPLSLTRDILVSKFAFTFNLYRYNESGVGVSRPSLVAWGNRKGLSPPQIPGVSSGSATGAGGKVGGSNPSGGAGGPVGGAGGRNPLPPLGGVPPLLPPSADPTAEDGGNKRPSRRRIF